MQHTEAKTTEKLIISEEPQVEKKEKFVPKGAMAFFVLLVILSLLFWYGIYLIMIERV